MKDVAIHIRRASLLIAVGLVIELLAFLYWAPATFIAFAAIGLPLIVGGVLWYLTAVAVFLRRQKAL